jgi:hypothetical protein
LHTPALQPPVEQTSHALPPVPQALTAVPGRQAPAAQQPSQPTLSQTHAPPSQCRPAAQAGPTPQAQSPDTAQPSARMASHFTHAAPAMPQLSREGGWQVPPAQQPPGHEAASQTPPPSTWQAAEQPSPETVL